MQWCHRLTNCNLRSGTRTWFFPSSWEAGNVITSVNYGMGPHNPIFYPSQFLVIQYDSRMSYSCQNIERGAQKGRIKHCLRGEYIKYFYGSLLSFFIFVWIYGSLWNLKKLVRKKKNNKWKLTIRKKVGLHNVLDKQKKSRINYWKKKKTHLDLKTTF